MANSILVGVLLTLACPSADEHATACLAVVEVVPCEAGANEEGHDEGEAVHCEDFFLRSVWDSQNGDVVMGWAKRVTDLEDWLVCGAVLDYRSVFCCWLVEYLGERGQSLIYTLEVMSNLSDFPRAR